jgi:hypothetical protein
MTMRSTKLLLAAASMAVLSAAGMSGANAASWNHYPDPVIRHEMRDMRYDMYRRIVDRQHVYETLRFHHYRSLGDPVFVHGRYVVRVVDRFGRPLFVEIDPYTGALIGEFRA